YVLAFFMRMFGSELSRAALLSGLSGLVSLALIYEIVLPLAGTAGALLAGVLTGVSYFFWRSSMAVMTEALSVSFGLIGVALFLQYLRTNRPHYFLGVGLFLGLATATRPQQVVLLGAGVVTCVLCKRSISRAQLVWLAGGAGLFSAALVPQYLYASSDTLLYTRIALFSPEYFWRGELGGDTLRPPWQIVAYLKALLFGGQLLFPPVAVLFIVGVYKGIRERNLVTVFMMSWIGGLLALLSVERYFSLRYLAPAVIPANVIASYAVPHLQRDLEARVGRAASRGATYTMMVLLMGTATVVGAITVVATIRAHNLRAAPYAYLKRESNVRDIVMGIGDAGRFYHQGPFFNLGRARPELLQQVVETARSVGTHVFVVLPLRRAGRVESEYGEEVGITDIRRVVESIGGRKVWEDNSIPPLSTWMPKNVVDRMSEAWAVYAF
ncbi:MAG: hypothetical protein E6K65_06055, partial [Nitrospirae bacterium]